MATDVSIASCVCGWEAADHWRQSVAFLEQTREEECFDKFFWIDQICIDQNSILENNLQVAMMAKIYSEADETIIWLGPHRLGLAACLESLADLDPSQ